MSMKAYIKSTKQYSISKRPFIVILFIISPAVELVTLSSLLDDDNVLSLRNVHHLTAQIKETSLLLLLFFIYYYYYYIDVNIKNINWQFAN